eukprot:362063-Chlamydomonas_euryale.AAC.7
MPAPQQPRPPPPALLQPPAPANPRASAAHLAHVAFQQVLYVALTLDPRAAAQRRSVQRGGSAADTLRRERSGGQRAAARPGCAFGVGGAAVPRRSGQRAVSQFGCAVGAAPLLRVLRLCSRHSVLRRGRAGMCARVSRAQARATGCAAVKALDVLQRRSDGQLVGRRHGGVSRFVPHVCPRVQLQDAARRALVLLLRRLLPQLQLLLFMLCEVLLNLPAFLLLLLLPACVVLLLLHIRDSLQLDERVTRSTVRTTVLRVSAVPSNATRRRRETRGVNVLRSGAETRMHGAARRRRAVQAVLRGWAEAWLPSALVHGHGAIHMRGLLRGGDVPRRRRGALPHSRAIPCRPRAIWRCRVVRDVRGAVLYRCAVCQRDIRQLKVASLC